ncbi:DUF4249 family protein [Cytophaga aurantiaca]|uniref:DUF4249 family protein n=1 Tax=Cytophaga aurantiaca TaxID=29530 RepID=UPI00036A06F0|nr:DUF4249 family protein [Cytophaga aurantiaca]
MRSIFLIVSALVLFSCQKVIDIHPPTGEEKVIIQAYLYTDTTAYAIITKSTDYLSKKIPPHISNAVVTLFDDHGHAEVLRWDFGAQRFEGRFMKGKVAETYTLKVDLEGKSYSATSTLLYLDPMDSITVVKEPKTIFLYEGYYMKLYGTVPTNIDKYYLFNGSSNDVSVTGYNYINCADNKLISGKLDGMNMGYKCDSLATAELEINSLTLAAYKFYEAANLQLNNDGGFFSTPPANVPSMFSNGAVGIFQCSDVQRLSTYVNVQ